MIATGIRRVWNAPTAWMWSFQFLRIAQGLILLPILKVTLSTEDFGMFTVFNQLYQLAPMLDMVFGPTLTRMFSYAMGGAKELKAIGLSEKITEGGEPNYSLVGQIVRNSLRFYRWLLLFLIVGMGIYGTWVVSGAVPQTTSPKQAWLAWGILLLAAPLEFYTGTWAVFLRGMNQMLLTSRLQSAVYFMKLLVSITLLLLGFGLLAIPISTLVTAFVQQAVIRRASLRLLPSAALEAPDANLFPVIWPTSWRTMVQLLSGYFAITSFSNIVFRQFGLSTQGEYGLSMMLIAQILSGFATAWVFVKWPLISQLRARGDNGELRNILRSRIWRQWVTFFLGMLGLLLIGPWLFGRLGFEKDVLPPEFLILMGLWVFLDINVVTWTTFLSTENRIPSLWPMTIANIASVGLAYVLAVKSDWGVASVIVAPMLMGALFNYWYWPHAGARNIGLSWVSVMFKRS